MNRSYFKILSFLSKLAIALILAWVIYQQVFANQNLDEIVNVLKSGISSSRLFLFIVALVLVVVNWTLEASRWGLIVNQYFPISFKNSVKAILMGVTLGIISPQRVGEYAGRLMVVPPDKNWLSIKASFYTSMSMNIVILSFGLLALYYSAFNQHLFVDISHNLIAIGAIITLVILLLLFRYFHFFERVFHLDRLFKYFDKWGDFTSYQFASPVLGKLVVYSILRYLVFLTQYYLLLNFFGINLPAQHIFASVAIIYLLQSSLPLPALLSLLARGEIALLVFSSFDVSEIIIFASTFLLWIINLMIPALLGIVIIWKTKLLETLGIEKTT